MNETDAGIDELDGCDIDGIRADLTSFGINPNGARFHRATVDISELAGWVCTLDSYLLGGDEDGYRRAVELADAYRDDPGSVPAIVIAALDELGLGVQVLDGLHRLAAAADARRSQIDAWILNTDSTTA